MGRLEAAHKQILEISLLIMEKSWNNHGILISNFLGNPDNDIIIDFDNHISDYKMGLKLEGMLKP